MIVDLDIDLPPKQEFDVCIAGAGPAGIILAKKLADSGYQVALLEGGSEAYTQKSQDLYECQSTARDMWPQQTRLRYLGGTSNHWAGRCRPFDRSDFDRAEFGGLPGWPINYAEIEPYLKEAMEILDLDSGDFKALNPPLKGNDFIADAFLKSPPTRFGQKYKSYLADSKNIICFLNANASRLIIEGNGNTVTALKVVNYNNKQYDISSSVFILSMGAIENARFLLNHEEISQQHEMLGKCFMEHLNIKLGEYILNDIDDVKRSYYTADHLSIDNKIGKSNLSFQSVKQIKSYGRTAKIKTFFKKLACDMSIEDKVQFIADFECPGTGVITTLTEQSPNKNSAVTLSEEKDNLGLKKAVINWEISATDLKTINKMAIELAKSFADSDLGLVKLEEYILDQTKPFDISPHAHHMGSTRMASSIEHGVVDKDCKVFGTENLYIAGSSIFATAGACNPTMPIIQFGLRLVDHLKNKQLSA